MGEVSTSEPTLASYVARVEAASNRSVAGAFDNGATIGEKRHLVGIVPELQDEVVVLYDSMRSKAAVHFCKVDGALAFMDLDRIAPAQSDVGASFAGEMDKVAL